MRRLRSALLLPALVAGCGHPAPALPAPASFTARPESLVTTTGTLYGTLLAPTDGRRAPVVFIHPGSGPTDRDGNSPLLKGPNNSLKLLAEGLAAQGIASLRVDKRGIAASRAAGPAREADYRFDRYVEDAAAWLGRLRADRRFTTVTALGHSEGALVVTLAAANGAADGVMLVAGAGRRAGDVLRSQLATAPDSVRRANERILARLEAGGAADSVPAALWMLYRASVQPYLISWLRHDPAEALRALGRPVLLVQGTTDVQVGMADFERLAAARPDARRLVVPGMNHVLKTASGTAAEQLPSYGDPSLPLAPGLAEGIGRFVLSLRAPSSGSSPPRAPAPPRPAASPRR